MLTDRQTFIVRTTKSMQLNHRVIQFQQKTSKIMFPFRHCWFFVLVHTLVNCLSQPFFFEVFAAVGQNCISLLLVHSFLAEEEITVNIHGSLWEPFLTIRRWSRVTCSELCYLLGSIKLEFSTVNNVALLYYKTRRNTIRHYFLQFTAEYL